MTQTWQEKEDLKHLQVEVTVAQGVAYLDGEVDDVSQRPRWNVRRSVTGVVEVVNKVQVQP